MGRRTALVLLACCAMMFLWGAAAEKLHTKKFRSPGFVQGRGEVVDNYNVVDMPKGHVAIRSFDAQVVDEHGTPIPLHETYLHHWIIVRYYVPNDAGSAEDRENRTIEVPNSGVCWEGDLPQMFGLGSETRRTNTTVPPPYGIVVGDPEAVPEGHEEVWVLNVHAIDTRGVVDVRGCTECLCDLYKAPENDQHDPIQNGYEGGLHCCYEGWQCALRPEFQQDNGQNSSSKRTLFMEYTVSWVDMSDEVVPVKVYILDVTNERTSIDDEDESHRCHVEYTVAKCAEGASTERAFTERASTERASKCMHTAENVAFLPTGGDVIYGVAHQHLGGIGSTLHNEDGGEICSSFPIYGDGVEAANEDGYIVGMTTCYPEPGSVKVRAGEKLRLRSFYDSEEMHTGVMGLFYLLVAEHQSPPRQHRFPTSMILVAVTITAAFIFIGVTISRQLKRRGGPEYQPV